MTDAARLAERRRLVVLAAGLQRATLARRVQRLRANPARHVLDFAMRVARQPAILSAGALAARYALRAWRQRRKAH